jgi:transposase InsO family protein
MKRTHGTGALYTKYRDGLSRRELAVKVEEERGQQRREKRGQKQRLRWKQPNLAWAIDATEYARDGHGQKLWVHAVKDLASRYHLEPLTALESSGVAVAAHLERLFRSQGAPLLLKRDNGSVFNHHAVNEVLARWGVIPLNSPAYYAPYNGAIEQGIKELKKEVARALPVPESWNVAQVGPFVAVAAAQRNYQPRRCLDGLNAKDIYSQKQRRGRWNQRQRHQAFEWISHRAKAILETRMKTDQRSVHAAWRHAVEAWLSDQALIEVH